MSIKTVLQTVDILDPKEPFSVQTRWNWLAGRLSQFKCKVLLDLTSQDEYSITYSGSILVDSLTKVEDALDKILHAVDFSHYKNIAQSKKYHKFNTKSWRWTLKLTNERVHFSVDIPKSMDKR